MSEKRSMGGVKKLYHINTDNGSSSWASAPREMSDEDYVSWLKSNQGQMIMLVVRRLCTRIVDEQDIKVIGVHAEAFMEFIQENVQTYAKAMRDAGTERLPQTGSLF